MVTKRRACDACYKRKIQCYSSEAGGDAACDWCQHHDLACTFDRVSRRKKRVTETGSRASLAKRLEQIEVALARSVVPQQTSTRSMGHTCTVCRSESSLRRLNRNSTPLGQIYFAGQNFGAICSRNGIPHFTNRGEQWIYAQTGQWPRFDHLYVDRSDDIGERAEIPAFSSSSRFPVAPRARLPEKGVLLLLLRAFVTSDFSRVFPLVDRALFEETARLAYEQSTPQTIEHVSAKACVFAFLSTVGTHFPELDAASDLDSDACAKEAQVLLSDILEDASITTLQTIFMLLLHETLCGHLQAASMYHAVACRTVFALGGHTLVHSRSKDGKPTAEEHEDGHLRMLFWLCYAFDKDIALRTGQPPIICDPFCDLTLPDGYEENHFADGRTGSSSYADVDSDSAANESQRPWLPSDLRLSLIKSKAVHALYSASSLRYWRLSVPAEFSSALSVRKHVKLADDLNKSKSMLHIELHLDYHYLLNVIHCASGRCLVDWNGPGKERTFGVQSSLDLSVEASRSTLIYLSAATHRLAGEAFWVFIFYPVSALMTLFFNILRNPLHEYAVHDVELLSSASDLIRSMPIRRVTAHETAYLQKMDGFVAELSRLSRCAIEKSRNSSSDAP
ncbi:hypothetical protein RJ55_06881 [Drechmeria coniospora]|nr:hypothetical protein RJ55_06881 [Drechmeria coniospora]